MIQQIAAVLNAGLGSAMVALVTALVFHPIATTLAMYGIGAAGFIAAAVAHRKGF